MFFTMSLNFSEFQGLTPMLQEYSEKGTEFNALVNFIHEHPAFKWLPDSI